MTATLTKRPAPDGGPGAVLVLDCEHATTTAWFVPGPTADVAEDDIVRIMLARHFQEQHCRCPVRLWRRYGLELQAVATPTFSMN